jgi:ATP-dependent RNA helicase RhlE
LFGCEPLSPSSSQIAFLLISKPLSVTACFQAGPVPFALPAEDAACGIRLRVVPYVITQFPCGLKLGQIQGISRTGRCGVSQKDTRMESASPVKDKVNQFSDFNISAALKQQLANAKFITPTPVQAAAIPPAIEGRDILATAQTGTGKTLSFLVPLVEKMQGEKTQTEGKSKNAFGLILLPTRELAMQVLDHYRKLTGNRGTAALVVGGLSEGTQLEQIRRGAQLIVATPGRLEDFLGRRLVNLSGVRMLVLDEVDRMLDMGFQPAIKRIVAALPTERQTLCYSATLSPAIGEIARNYLRNAARIEIGSVLKPSENVELQTFEVDKEKKHELLEHLLDSNHGSFLVFVRTKHGADRVARRLARSGHKATSIHGDRSQSQRNAALRSFAQGQHRVLVATDVAARGIDVADVAHVVNYDMPREAEDFVHRIGRTGRASRRGVASTFAQPDEKGDLRKIERTLSINMKRFRVRTKVAEQQIA